MVSLNERDSALWCLEFETPFFKPVTELITNNIQKCLGVSRIYSGNYKYYIHQAIRWRSSQDSGILAEILAITHLRACMDFVRESFLVYHPSTSGHFVGASGDPSQRQGAGGADCRGSYFIYEPVHNSWKNLLGTTTLHQLSRDPTNFRGLVLGCIEAKFCK